MNRVTSCRIASHRNTWRYSAPRIEAVEPRRLLAQLVGTQLLIDTGMGNDRVLVEAVGDRLLVVTGRARQWFAAANVASIVANLGPGNDQIQIAENVDVPTTLDGGAGNDLLSGGPNADSIVGGNGDDSLLGNAGDDVILPGLGNNTVDAGEGEDEVSYEDRTTGVSIVFSHSIIFVGPPVQYLAFSNATVTSGDGTDVLRELETATLTPANDSVYMTAYRWSDYSGPLQNRVYRINAGDGDDQITVNSGLSGFPDFVQGQIIDGGKGNDRFDTFVRPTTTLLGGDGDDTVVAAASDAQAPTIDAGNGRDYFIYYSLSVDYVMPAGLEDISAAAEQGSVRVIGNQLPNVISIRAPGNAYAEGGSGDDVITGYSSNHALPVTLMGDAGNDTITLVGEGQNLLDGGTGDDCITGGAGNDTLLGDDGNDRLDGGAGDDYLDGGAGIDSLYGGAGTDTAVSDASDAVVDSIEIFVGGRETRRSRLDVNAVQ